MLAPAMTTPSGTPLASVSTLRLTPRLPRSVGLRPLFFPAQGRLAHAPVCAQIPPVHPGQRVILGHRQRPQPLPDACFHPFHEPVVRRAVRTNPRRVQRPPLAAGAQQEKNRVRAVAVRAPGAPTAEAVRVLARRYHRRQFPPPHVREPVTAVLAHPGLVSGIPPQAQERVIRIGSKRAATTTRYADGMADGTPTA